MADTLKTLAQEIKTLAPACLAPTPPQTVTYHPGELKPINKKFTDIQATLLYHPKKEYILLAANTKDYPVNTKFSLSLLTNIGKVEKMFTGEFLEVEAQSFSERIEAMGTRAYLLKDIHSLPSSELVKIKIEMDADTKLALNEPTTDVEQQRMGKKNKLPNSSFESTTVSGWPDFYFYRSPGRGYQYKPNNRIGALNELWGIDTNQAFHGRASLRMSGPSGISRQTFTYINIDQELSQSQTQTFSSWMRASQEGTTLEMMVVGGGNKRCVLSQEWQRYTMSFKLADTESLVIRWHQSEENNQGGDIWIDAVQLEAGEQATDYEL